jgi:multidrug efflux pump subunit AcrB
MPQYQVASLREIGAIPVTGAGGGRAQLMEGLTSIRRGAGMAVVSHYNVQPAVDIFGSVQGRDLGAVSRDMAPILEASRASLPRGSQLMVRGQIETMRTSFAGLLTGLAFAIVLVYLLIVVNFQSWLDPFIIVSALPAALAGILWMLFVSETTISVPALTGAIMCVGVATANSILIVSYAKDEVARGCRALDAALEAGVMRFRPVLMTALAMIIGMIPMALGMGEGGEQNAPLGRAVVGGLALATVATLLFVPAVFALLHRSGVRTSMAPAVPAGLEVPGARGSENQS